MERIRAVLRSIITSSGVHVRIFGRTNSIIRQIRYARKKETAGFLILRFFALFVSVE